MIDFAQGHTIGDYTILYPITKKAYTQTYCVADEKNNQFFMKLYDMQATPVELLHGQEPKEVWAYRKLGTCENLMHLTSFSRVKKHFYDITYMVFPLSRGKLLSQYIDEKRTLTLREIMDITLGLLQAVRHLNAHQLCHLDIVPQNIILESDQDGKLTAKLFDLEHAVEYNENGTRRLSSAKQFEKLSPYYTHSNLLSRQEVSGMDDIFSIGAVLFTMLSGKKPWSECPLTPEMPAVAQHLKMNEWRKEHPSTDIVEPLRPSKIGSSQTAANLFVAMDMALKGEANIKTLLHVLHTENKELDQIAEDVSLWNARNVDEIKGFASIAGMDDLKQKMAQHVLWPLQHPEKAERYRLQLPNGVLLYGPPGCGKTYFASKIAEELHWPMKFITSASIGSAYIHETSQNIKELFQAAATCEHCVICIDEIDGILSKRSTEGTERSRNDEVNQFLAEFNECHKRGILVVGTTNRKEIIDPAALRAGRFDIQIEIPAPDEKMRQRLFEMYLRNRPLAEDIDIPALVKMTVHYASADVPFVVNEAALMAAIEDVPISQRHLTNSINHHQSSLHTDPRPRIGFNA